MIFHFNPKNKTRLKGFLLLPRDFFHSWLWLEKRTFEAADAYLDLLQLAAFVPTKRLVNGKLITLAVGELVASERFLETRWNWSRTKVRQFLEILEKDQRLDHRKDQQETIRIVCRYKDFCGQGDTEKTSNQTTEKTSGEPAGNQERTSGEPNINNSKEEVIFSTKKPPRQEFPALEDVKAYAASAPVPIPPECAVAFYDTQEAAGWITRHGHPIADWRAALRRYASHWHQNEQTKPRWSNQQSKPDHREQKRKNEFPETRIPLPRLA